VWCTLGSSVIISTRICKTHTHIYSHMIEVTIDGVWICNRLYWPLLTHNSWVHFTNHCQTQTSVLSLLQSPLAVAWYRLPTADVTLTLGSRTVPMPQLPASQSNSSKRLNCSSVLTHSLTHSLRNSSLTDWTVLLITSRHGPTENTVLLLLCNCCRGNMLVCKAVTSQRLLCSCFFRGRYLATGLHVTIIYDIYVRVKLISHYAISVYLGNKLSSFNTLHESKLSSRSH
jgi:hypothetical protein